MYEDIVDFIRSHYEAAAGETVMLHAPTFAGNEKKYLNECIDSTFVSSVGPFVDRFENEIAKFTGATKAVVCVSGTNALHMAMMLVGVERDDEVLTQALTFIATCNAISYIGAHPVFIDVDLDTMGLSPDALERWLEKNAEMRHGECFNKTTGRRIKACVPMHTFGHPVRLDEIVDICRRWNIELVEDAAESIGSYYKGRHTGTFVHDHIGYNYRMPNINAALGCAQLEQIDRFLESKRATAQAYIDYFAGEPHGVRFMKEPDGTRSNYWLNAVLLPDHESQQAFLQFTNDHGVMTRPVWELMNRLDMFKDAQTDGLKNTAYLADRIVNIPSSVKL